MQDGAYWEYRESTSDLLTRFSAWAERQVSVHVGCNDHKISYETVEEWESHRTDGGGASYWINAEQREQAISTDTFWEVHWYPDTPVGFCVVWAATLEAAIAEVMEHKQ